MIHLPVAAEIGTTGNVARSSGTVARRATSWPSAIPFYGRKPQVLLSLLCRTPGRSDPSPEIGELDGVEEGDDINYFFILHSHIPRVGVLVGFAVEGRAVAVEECDHHVAVAVEGADGGNETLRHARAEWSDDLVDELFLAVVGARHGRVADDGPFCVVGKDVEDSARAGDPFVEAGLNDLLVARLVGFGVVGHLCLSFSRFDWPSVWGNCLNTTHVKQSR